MQRAGLGPSSLSVCVQFVVGFDSVECYPSSLPLLHLSIIHCCLWSTNHKFVIAKGTAKGQSWNLLANYTLHQHSRRIAFTILNMATLRPLGSSSWRQFLRRGNETGLRPAIAGSGAVRWLSGLTINSNRLQESIHHTCQWGAAHRYGRLGQSDLSYGHMDMINETD